MNAEMSPKQAELAEYRSHVVDRYLDQLKGEDFTFAEHIAQELDNPEQPISDTIVIIPVAAHQEASQVANTLYQYSKQKVDRPFTVVLGLNCPNDKASSKEVADTVSAVEEAKQRHPNLDIRTSFVTYEEPVIGRIKRDIWNGVALRAQQDGTISNSTEVLGINHDIDLVRLGSNYIRNVQNYYQEQDSKTILPDASILSFTRSSHGSSPDHPNISAAVRWNDFILRKSGQGFEAGMIVPLSKYAGLGGIDPTKKIGEILSLFHFMPPLIPATTMVTSPRRYIDHFEEHGYEIWRQDNFGANDRCRDKLAKPDVTQDKMLEVVDETLLPFVERIFPKLKVAAKIEAMSEAAERDVPIDFDEIYARQKVKLVEGLPKTQNTAVYALKRMVGSDVLANKLDEHFEACKDQIQEIEPRHLALQRIRIVI